MFAFVKRSIRPLACVLIAAQLLLSAPMVSALSAMSAPDSMPCAGMMPDTEPCPCCPDGTENMAQCLSACTAAFAISSAPFAVVPVRTISPSSAPLFVSRHALADPPVKPPPIR